MIQSTNAFILSYLKYGDSSIILNCFTQNFGFKTFIIKNAFLKKNKKTQYLFALNEVEISFYPKYNSSLELIKSINQSTVYQSIYTEISKSSVVTFLSEVLLQLLKKETDNLPLYAFIKESLTDLDKKNIHFADFHLWFLLNITKELGFYPLLETELFNSFDLNEGKFIFSKISSEENKRISLLWNQLIDFDFHTSENCFTSNTRKIMLNQILAYFEIHFENFRQPQSLEILSIVFD